MAETQFRIWGWPKVGTGSAGMAVSYHITRAEAHAELARVSERFSPLGLPCRRSGDGVMRLYAEMLIERDRAEGDELVTVMVPVTVEGCYRRAEPSAGIMWDYPEFWNATDRDGEDVELTEAEIEQAEDALWRAR